MVIIALMNRRGELRFRFAGEFSKRSEARPQKVELGVQSRDSPKFKTPSGLTTNCPSPPKTPAPSMHVACNRHLSPGMGCWQSHGQPDSLKQTPTMYLTGTPNPCHATIGVPAPLLQHELPGCCIRVRHRSFCLPPSRYI